MDWYSSHKAWARHYDLNNHSDFVKKCNESRQLQEDKKLQDKVKIPTHQTVQRSLEESTPEKS